MNLACLSVLLCSGSTTRGGSLVQFSIIWDVQTGKNGSKNTIKAIGKWVLFLFAAKENVCTSSDDFPKFFLVTKCLVFKCISDLFSEIVIFSRCILLFVQKCFILSKCDQIGSQCSETNEREFLRTS